MAALGCFEEGLPREASPVGDLEVSGWGFDGLRSHRTHRRETALGLGVAICLHAVVPALVVLLGLLFAVPSASEPPVVMVSLVSLAGAGNGSGGAPGALGAGPAGSGGKHASLSPVKIAVAVQKKSLTGPQNGFAGPAKPAEHVSTRRPVPSGHRGKKAALAAARSIEFSSRPASHRDAASSVPPDAPASAPGGASLAQSAAACGAASGSNGGPAGGNSLPGGGGEGRGGVPGFGTGSGGFDLREVDTPPVPIKKVQPEFPDEARQMGISGRVVLKFLVEADGRVTRASILTARPVGVFNRSALAAIVEWRFKPGLYRGKPVAAWVELPVSFHLAR